MGHHLESTGTARGHLASAQDMYDLARDWYRGRMDEDWNPPSPAEAERIFARHGMVGDFWKLS